VDQSADQSPSRHGANICVRPDAGGHIKTAERMPFGYAGFLCPARTLAERGKLRCL
jgi:hypothetical protein